MRNISKTMVRVILLVWISAYTSYAMGQSAPPADKTIAVDSAYTYWLTLSPGECVSDDEFKAYFKMIVYALEVLKSDRLVGDLLQQLADQERCIKVVGRTMVSLYEFSSKVEIKDYEEWVFITNDVDTPIETIEIGDFNPFYCLTSVTASQTNWNAGTWADNHKLICTIAAVGTIETHWKAGQIESKSTIDSLLNYKLNFWAKSGGIAKYTKKYAITNKYAVMPDSKASSYTLDIKVPPGEGKSTMKASFAKRPVNRKGRAYPRLKSIGRSEVPFPDAPPKMNPKRKAGAAFNKNCKTLYAKNKWVYPDPQNPSLVAYQNHHIRPVRWAGKDSGKNCYRLTNGAHHWFSVWWEVKGNFRTPKSR